MAVQVLEKVFLTNVEYLNLSHIYAPHSTVDLTCVVLTYVKTLHIEVYLRKL